MQIPLLEEVLRIIVTNCAPNYLSADFVVAMAFEPTSKNPMFNSLENQGGNYSSGRWNNNSSSSWQDNRPAPFRCFENNLVDRRDLKRMFDQGTHEKVRISADESYEMAGIAFTGPARVTSLAEKTSSVIQTRITTNYVKSMFRIGILENVLDLNVDDRTFKLLIKNIIATYNQVGHVPESVAKFVKKTAVGSCGARIA